MAYRSVDSKREVIIDYIRKNPKATYKDIRKDTKLHPERLFRGGLAGVFKEAGIKPPRTFERKTREQRRKIILDYLKKNPKAGGHTIAKDIKINVASAFKNLKEASEFAGIEYTRTQKNRSKEQRRQETVQLIRRNPNLTVAEITSKLNFGIYKIFKNIKEMYETAGIKRPDRSYERILEVRGKVVKFIKKNPLSTQREINRACKTKVQNLFDRGIFDAFKEANISYPFERLKLYGTALKEIKKRARNFEKKIAVKLSGYGVVNRLVKTKRGVADVILERKGKKIIVEIKDYLNKEISISQIKQLNKYLEDCSCNLGFLICHKKPKKDKFIIGKNKIFILEETEIDNIRNII